MTGTTTRENIAGQFTTGAVTVTSAGAEVTTLLSEDRERRSAVVVNIGTVPVWLSNTPQRREVGGFYLAVNAGIVMTHGRAVFAFCQQGANVDGLLSTYVETGEL